MIYFAKETGEVYIEPYIELPDYYDVRRKYCYINAKKEGNYVLDTYTDINNGDKVITMSQAIYENGKFIGVVGLDMILEFSE